MILVDTSVWIGWLSEGARPNLKDSDLTSIFICPPIMQELLQGVREDRYYRKLKETLLALPCLDRDIPLERFLEAAEIYRFGREKGYTIRSSIDCLIAAIAIKHQIELFHKDRDFKFIAKFTALKLVERFKT